MAEERSNLQGNNSNTVVSAIFGLNLDNVNLQIKDGQLTYALNATIEGFDGNMVTYQNEESNIKCTDFPAGFKVIGHLILSEQDKIVFFIFNEETKSSEIGFVDINTCKYSKLINADCLNFSMLHPIQAKYRTTDCTTQIFFTDFYNPRRYIDLNELPYKKEGENCDEQVTNIIDCNLMLVQRQFSIPNLFVTEVVGEGSLVEGTYQFTIQYADELGNGFSDYHSVTNPASIFAGVQSNNFDNITSKAVNILIDGLDRTFEYYNLAVIKTINNIPSVELIGTFPINSTREEYLYTGVTSTQEPLSIDEILLKRAIYPYAKEIATVDNVLVYGNLISDKRINYQSIANQIELQWETWKVPDNIYSKGESSANLRGYMRDEVYAFEIAFLLRSGKQTDGFHIPGRKSKASDLEVVNNDDVIYEEDSKCEIIQRVGLPRWKVYNTGCRIDYSKQYKDFINRNSPTTNLAVEYSYHPGPFPNDPGNPPEEPNNTDPSCYTGPYEYGCMGYYESTEEYSCNTEIWGDLAGEKQRFHKFPDCLISPIHDENGSIYPIGIRIDSTQIKTLIDNSNLTQEEKDNIVGYKILRGNRANNKSVVAKGLLFNVGKYNKDTSTYFYPNYPYNDLRPDPFLTNKDISSGVDLGEELNSSFEEVGTEGSNLTTFYDAVIPAFSWKNNNDTIVIQYNGTFNGDPKHFKSLYLLFNNIEIFNSNIFSTDPNDSFTLITELKRVDSAATILIKNTLNIIGANPKTIKKTITINSVALNTPNTVTLKGKVVRGSLLTSPPPVEDGEITAQGYIMGYRAAPSIAEDPGLLNGFISTDSKKRFTLHSPDTSFYQPFLGNVLKIESIEQGKSISHFAQVQNHARYKIYTDSLFLTAIGAAAVITGLSRWVLVGVSSGGTLIDGNAAINTYQTLTSIFQNLVPYINYAYQFNSIGNYNKSINVDNNGSKQRLIDLSSYLIPGIVGVGDTNLINNYQRESSVYIRTNKSLPFTHEQGGVLDESRWNLGCQGLGTTRETNISSYYASIKRNIANQYGRMYSYETIDTGFQYPISFTGVSTVFGGDIFINRFGLKRKLPFFTYNGVGLNDGADIEYNNISNVGNAKYWYSSQTKADGGSGFLSRLAGILFGTKVHELDCDRSSFFYRTGKMYLFAYGLPYFYTESEVNVDFRHAADSQIRDFYPKNNQLVIPDDWFQEKNVSIINDNSYIYNKTYSKQNKENLFTHLREDFKEDESCYVYYPTRLIYSDRITNTKKSTWLFSKPANFYDLPNIYGRLRGLDGLENNQLLVRFENKTQMYNAMVSIDTTNGKSAYVGGNELFRNIPLDFFDTDEGYSGSNNRMLLKSELGHLFVDEKRGNVYLLSASGQVGLQDITNGLSKWFTQNMPFVINKYFPNIDIDNSYNGIGITGVWDSKYNRFIITKLDYEPIVDNIVYNEDTGKFTLNGNVIELSDRRYFCNKSFTLSYCPDTKSWISFHSYIPNFYTPYIGSFFSGVNSNISNIWQHNISPTNYQRFYGKLEPYILEYPIKFGLDDEILSSVKDYVTILEYKNDQDFYEVNYGVYFNKAIIYNNQQCSGTLNLIPKPLNSLKAYSTYPKLNTNSKDILVTKSDNLFNYNTFWDLKNDNVNDTFFKKSCVNRTIDKELDNSVLDYSRMSHKKGRIRAKNLRIRHIQDATDKYKFVSKYLTISTQKSIK